MLYTHTHTGDAGTSSSTQRLVAPISGAVAVVTVLVLGCIASCAVMRRRRLNELAAAAARKRHHHSGHSTQRTLESCPIQISIRV
jgi:hypothetical protein